MGNDKPKYQPWNEEEFNADVYVRGMTHIQRWMYRTLLQASFFHTTRPYLPKDDKILWVLAGCETRKQWDENKAEILERFTTAEHDDTLMENKRVTADWNNLQEFRDEQAAKGKQRAAGADRDGGKFVKKGFIAVTSPAPATAGEATSREPAGNQQEKESEVKRSEVKGSESGGQGTGAAPAKHGGGDWHALSHRHKRYFGKPITDPRRHKDKYAEMCMAYGEDIVLDCFDAWASEKSSWIKDKDFGNPLFLFWKDLPDMAADAVASKQTEALEAVQAQQQAAERKKDDAIIEQNVQRQKDEHTARWTAEPAPEVGASVLDYLQDLEGKN